MALTRDDIVRLAKLAHLELSEEEQVRFASEISGTLLHIDELANIPTDGVDILDHVGGVVNALRPDAVVSEYDRTQMIVTSALDSRDGALVVPKVVDKDAA